MGGLVSLCTNRPQAPALSRLSHDRDPRHVVIPRVYAARQLVELVHLGLALLLRLTLGVGLGLALSLVEVGRLWGRGQRVSEWWRRAISEMSLLEPVTADVEAVFGDWTHHVRDLVIALATLLLSSHVSCVHGLVGLGELAEAGKGVGAKLREDTGDELSELLVSTLAVDGKGVGGSANAVDCKCSGTAVENQVRR